MATPPICVTRSCDFAIGHRVIPFGDDPVRAVQCGHLHGHSMRARFSLTHDRQEQRPHVDFDAAHEALMRWLSAEWNGRFLIARGDPWMVPLHDLDAGGVVALPFAPSVENLALHLLLVVAPRLLTGSGVRLVACTLQQARGRKVRAYL